jgi:hypothetical protein
MQCRAMGCIGFPVTDAPQLLSESSFSFVLIEFDFSLEVK